MTDMQHLGDKPGQRLLVVANRLPVNVTINPDDGSVETKMASGGLVSGLQALSKSMQFQWFGWPGTDIHRNDRQRVRDELESQYNAVPIFLKSQDVEDHYNGFSSKSSSTSSALESRKADRLVPKTLCCGLSYTVYLTEPSSTRIGSQHT